MPSTANKEHGFTQAQVEEIANASNALLADVFTLYLKTKNFHWHMKGPHFREYHLLLDEHAGQLQAMTDAIAERVRKIGAPTLHSIGEISRLQRITDSERRNLTASEMLEELADDERALLGYLRTSHNLCNAAASTSLLENWIDESEQRQWFLKQTLSL